MITATLALRLLVDLRDHGPMASQTQATENVYMDLRRDKLDLFLKLICLSIFFFFF